MPAIDTPLNPVAPRERIPALDILRGFALLGILIMNVQFFAMPDAAYFNPTAYGDLTGLNRWVWIFGHIVADQKFMTLFSMLFGAGILLVSQRAADREQRPAGLHYRRIFWLFVIGMLHAYLLWAGDILVAYALCGVVVYLLRNREAKTLLILGVLSLAVGSLMSIMGGLSMPFWPPEAVQQNMQRWSPSAATIQTQLTAYRGGWLDQMGERVPATIAMQTFGFFFWASWRAGGLMLIGMALYKWGVLTAERSDRFYVWLTTAGLAVGLPLVIWGIVRHFQAGWTMEYSMFFGSQFNYWGSLFVSLGWMGTVMLITRSGVLPALRERLAAVGRTALSNYLLQTILCTVIFYGHGLGLYGHVERWGQILIVLGIWGLQLVISPWWLSRYRFGPAEWLWRSLTYWRRQRMVVKGATA